MLFKNCQKDLYRILPSVIYLQAQNPQFNGTSHATAYTCMLSTPVLKNNHPVKLYTYIWLFQKITLSFWVSFVWVSCMTQNYRWMDRQINKWLLSFVYVVDQDSWYIVSHDAKKQHSCTSSGLHKHHSELFTCTAATKF